MRILSLVCSIIFLNLSVQAQDSALVWGNDIKFGRDDKYISLIGMDQEVVYSAKNLNSNSTAFVFEKFQRENLSLLSSKSIDFPMYDGQIMDYEDLYFVRGVFYLFTSIYNSETDSKLAFCTRMDTDGNWLDEPVKIGELYVKKWNTAQFKIEFSRDSSLFMIYHVLPYNKKSSEFFAIKVYQTDLVILWEKEIELPYGESAFEITEYHLDDKGNVSLLAGSNQKKVKDDLLWKQLRKKKYVLFTYDWKLNKVTEFDVSLKNKWIISVTSEINFNGDVSVAGFYSNDQYFSIAGTFFFTLDGDDHSVLAKGMMAFDKSFLGQFMNKKKVEKGKELGNFFLDHLVLRKNGSALMVAEHFEVNERVTSDPATGRHIVTNYYNYNDVIVIYINPNGSIKWARRVPKEQSTTKESKHYCGYVFVDTGSFTHLLYNDNPSNFDLLKQDASAELYTFNNLKKTNAVLCTLDSEGVLTRDRLYSFKSAETVFRPDLFLQNGRDLLIYNQFKRNYRFAKLDLSHFESLSP